MQRFGTGFRGMAGLSVALLVVAGATPVLAASIHDRIYPAPTVPIATATLPAGTARVTVTTADALAITGAEIAAQTGKPTLLVFHGNGSSAMDTLDWFAPLIARGYGVVAAEYRGYSGNPGRADEPGLARDADAFFAEARRLAGGGRLIVIGHSLGGGVAFGLATRQKLDALVTIGTFSSLRAMVPKIARAFISDRYDNLAAVPTLDEPLFLIHGTADATVPAQMGNALHNAAITAKRDGFSLVIRGADHHPPAATISALIDMIAAHLEHPDAALGALPEKVELYRFKAGSFGKGLPAR